VKVECFEYQMPHGGADLACQIPPGPRWGFDTEKYFYAIFFVKFPIVGRRCLSNAPWWGEIFVSNPPTETRGVGQYIDRCIRSELLFIALESMYPSIIYGMSELRLILHS